MQNLDYWRCSHCSVILAQHVVVPDHGTITATCWKCGEVSTVGEASPFVTGADDLIKLASEYDVAAYRAANRLPIAGAFDRMPEDGGITGHLGEGAFTGYLANDANGDEVVIVHPLVSEVATDILLVDEQGQPSGVKTILSKPRKGKGSE